jgi:hypothetical protein
VPANVGLRKRGYSALSRRLRQGWFERLILAPPSMEEKRLDQLIVMALLSFAFPI